MFETWHHDKDNNRELQSFISVVLMWDNTALDPSCTPYLNKGWFSSMVQEEC